MDRKRKTQSPQRSAQRATPETGEELVGAQDRATGRIQLHELTTGHGVYGALLEDNTVWFSLVRPVVGSSSPASVSIDIGPVANLFSWHLRTGEIEALRPPIDGHVVFFGAVQGHALLLDRGDRSAGHESRPGDTLWSWDMDTGQATKLPVPAPWVDDRISPVVDAYLDDGRILFSERSPGDVLRGFAPSIATGRTRRSC